MKRLSLLAFMFLAACTASTEEAESSSGQAIGERWLSPIDVGSYDGPDQTITVRNTFQSQEVYSMARDVPLFGSVRVRDHGVAEVLDPDGEVAFSLERSGRDLRLLTVYDNAVKLVRRAPDALKGTYGDFTSTDHVIVVTASSDDGFAVEVYYKTGETPVKVPLSANVKVGTFGSLAFPGCLLSVFRENGEFGIWATDSEYLPAARDGHCELFGKYYPKQHYANSQAAADL